MPRGRPRLDEDAAVAIALEKRWQPTVPYVSNKTPWIGYCLVCGYPGAPTLTNIKKQSSACGVCTGRRQDGHIRVGKLMALDFLPSLTYVDNCTPMPGVCFRCHQPISPSFNNVWNTKSACAYCSKVRVDDAILIGKMLAVDLEPLEPYPGAANLPWMSRCLRCGYTNDRNYSSAARGQGCRECSNNCGYQQHVPGALYAVADDSRTIVKVGVSSHQRVKERMQVHASRGLNVVLHVRYEQDGETPWQLEKTWKQYVRVHPEFAVSRDVLPDGFTEALYVHEGVWDVIENLFGS